MIKPGEIQQKARKLAVRDQQIEKDGSTTFCVEAYPNPHGKRVLLF